MALGGEERVMADYTQLDQLIIGKIYSGAKSFAAIDNGDVYLEANRLHVETGRPAFRIIDGRLQALREKGLIIFDYKRQWSIV